MRTGIYNIEYFSGSSATLYIGDVLVDEITSYSFSRQQNKRPIYGYSSQLFDAVTKGTVLIQGSFTINFKEAGYIWLILDRYQKLINGKESVVDKDNKTFASHALTSNGSPWDTAGGPQFQFNIERIMNGEASAAERSNALMDVALAKASLTGYPSKGREAASKIDPKLHAEHQFEGFEDAIWKDKKDALNAATRAADDPRLNPFEIYLSFGDFGDTDYDNHTMQRLMDVHIIGSGKQVQISGQPIQEQYTFIARNLV
jgi:hypothetical protein